MQSSIQTFTKTQEQEAALALYISQHSAIAPIDHLSSLCKNKFDDTVSCVQIKMLRTKCTNLIKNVLAPHFVEDLYIDIGDSKFSLLLDESTDISVIKLLGIVIKYFSKKQQKIVSTFLSMAELESGNAGLHSETPCVHFNTRSTIIYVTYYSTSNIRMHLGEVSERSPESIVNCLKNELKKFKLNIKNLIGIGTNNANVMVGCNKSVYTEMKKQVPHLILIKCVCHSV